MFLKGGVAAGGGLMLAFGLPALLDDAAAAASSSFAPNAFIRIDSGGSVTLIMPHVEMGQGTYTSIPMLIAEELEVALSQVRLEHAPPDEKRYGNPLFGGVQGTAHQARCAVWEPLRQAGATARVMLIAAQSWNVDPSSSSGARRSTRRARAGSHTAFLPAMQRRCPFLKRWRSNDRKNSS
jgi:isoquinoline 1-oxidoreductase beta subunit